MGAAGQVAITGVGQTRSAKVLHGYTNLGVLVEASAQAIVDAGLRPSDIDGIVCHGESTPGHPSRDNFEIASALGIAEVGFTTLVAMGGATAGTCIEVARQAILDGRCRHVLVAGGGSLSSYGGAPDASGGAAANYMGALPHHSISYEQAFGGSIPIYYALVKQRHMHEFGSTPEQFAEIAVSHRRHASMHPDAVVRDPISVHDVLNSRLIASPLHLLECAVPNDGGSALVLSAGDRAADMPQRPVVIAGAGYAQSYYYTAKLARGSSEGFDLVHPVGRAAAEMAFGEAGVGPAEVDVALLYDSFTITVMLQLEAFGFCPPGAGGSFVENGGIELGGRLPVNTHGGHMGGLQFSGFGHPIEAVRQLRAECGDRQVADAKVALVSSVASVASTYSLVVLTRG